MDIGQRLVRTWLLSDGVGDKKNGVGSRIGSLVVLEKWSEGRPGSFLMGMMSETEDVIDIALRPRELEGTNGLIGSPRINWMRVTLFRFLSGARAGAASDARRGRFEKSDLGSPSSNVDLQSEWFRVRFGSPY